MRFVVTGEWSKNQLLRLIMVMFLGFVACFWLVTTLLFVEKMGFSAAGVAQYFLGDPELEFGQPARSYGSMLETSHMHLFAMGMLVMVLTHLLLFAPIPVPVKFWSVLATFGFTFMNEAANWMVRYFGASWAWVKLFFCGDAGFLHCARSGLVGLHHQTLKKRIQRQRAPSHPLRTPKGCISASVIFRGKRDNATPSR